MATYFDTETRTGRNASMFDYQKNNVLDNQMTFDTPNYNSGYTSFVEEQPEESSSSYEIEKGYNINGIEDDVATIEPTFMPTIENMQSSKIKKVENSFKLKLNARGKILVSVFSIVVSLLVGFCVYNAVVIANLNKELNAVQFQEKEITKTINDLQNTDKSLTSSTNIKESLSDSYENGVVMKMQIDERPEIVKPEISTNWFDEICKFLSNLFD